MRKTRFSRLIYPTLRPFFVFPLAALLFFSLLGYGQTLSKEDFQFRFDGGTSLPCPTPDKFIGSRPAPSGKPTQVGVGMYFIQIPEIDDVEETFDADVFYLRYWNDPRLSDSERGQSYAFCTLPIDGFWMPALEILNLRESTERGDSYALIDAKGNVLLVERFTLILSNPMDLSGFPFDQQKLRIQLEPLFSSDREILLYPLEKYVQKADGLYVNGWKLGEPRTNVSTEYAKLRGIDYSRMEISLQVAREKGFFLRKLIIPLVLIVLMSWTIFWVNPEQTAPQIGLGATSMLTIIAYQFALANMLPRISYQTRADSFILWSLILVFLALAEAVSTAALVNAGKKHLALKMDHVCRLGFPIVYVFVIVKSLLI
jgi:hypothetical protein